MPVRKKRSAQCRLRQLRERPRVHGRSRLMETVVLHLARRPRRRQFVDGAGGHTGKAGSDDQETHSLTGRQVVRFTVRKVNVDWTRSTPGIFLIRRGQDLKARRTSTSRCRGRIERRCPRSKPPWPTYRRSRNAICWPVNPIIYCASFFETCKTWSDCTPTSSLACPASNASNRH